MVVAMIQTMTTRYDCHDHCGDRLAIRLWTCSPIGSMYGIYANIGGILMGSMLPYIAYMDPMGVMLLYLFETSHGGFPSHGGTPSHPFYFGFFTNRPSSYWGTPHLWTPPYVISMKLLLWQLLELLLSPVPNAEGCCDRLLEIFAPICLKM